MRLLVIACFLCALSLPVQAQSLEHDGLKRTYKIYQPARTDKHPLILLLHGGTMNAARAWRISEFPDLAAREGLTLIAPDAVDGHWNDGRQSALWTDKAINLHDDVGFLSALIDKAIKEYNIDPARVYITGGSNGGHMAFRMACERSEKIAGIAPIISTMQEKIAAHCTAKKTMAVIYMAGTDDPLIPYEGGTSSKATREAKKPDFEPRLSAPQSAAFWAKQNGCDATPDSQKLPDLNTDDHSYIIAHIFRNCRPRGNTAFYEIVGGGHHVPSLKPYRFLNNFLTKKLGTHNHDINSAQVIWDFFEKSAQ